MKEHLCLSTWYGYIKSTLRQLDLKYMHAFIYTCTLTQGYLLIAIIVHLAIPSKIFVYKQ